MTDAITLDKPKSKYTMTDIPGGFLVEREGGLQLGVTYGDTWLHVGSVNVGLYCFPKMVEEVAGYFLEAQWNRYLRKNDRKAGTEMIARALSRRLKPHWQRLMAEFVPEEVAALARLMWSSVHGDAKILHDEALYADEFRHLRADLLKYHACRLVAKAFYERLNDDLPLIANWRNLLTPSVPFKALNKTLDALPPAISFKDIERLRFMKLEQPISNRLHLLFALTSTEHRHWGLHERAIMNGDADAIREGAALFGWNLTTRARTADIRRAANLILDYPQAYGGELLGLARRSHEWHEQGHYRDSSDGLPPDYALPLLNLDYAMLGEEGIEPLRTVGAVYQEGEIMQHCVASYASHAAQGGCFLFHVEHNGQWATLEVSSAGEVRQAYGPRNTRNAACDWGVEMLAAAVAQERRLRVVEPIRGLPF